MALIAGVSILAGCNNNNGRTLADYPEASTGDSLLYYYIQMRAHEYWDRAASDTMLNSAEQRERFAQGVEKGLSLVTDDDNYNQALRIGIRMGINLRDFEKKYDIDLDDEIIMASLRNGLSDERDIDILEDQREFYRLLAEMKETIKGRDKEIASKALVKEAQSRKLQKLGDNIYYKIMREGSGPKVTDGDIIEVSADYQRIDGDNLGLPSPVTVTVGQAGIPKVMNLAYKTLKHGSMAQFATSAYQLFGSRTAIMGLNDSDIVIVSMILNNIVSPSDDSHPGSSSLK